MIRAAFACLALLAVVACTSATIQPTPTPTPTPTPSATVRQIPVSFWLVPKQHLTPGAVVACTLPRPPKERNVPLAEKRAIVGPKAYNYTGPWSAVEFDHRVPFALCGSNGPLNIWPEPIDTAKRKDQLEDAVIRLVKAHRLTLGQGQAVFLGDWRTGYCTYVGGAPCLN